MPINYSFQECPKEGKKKINGTKQDQKWKEWQPDKQKVCQKDIKNDQNMTKALQRELLKAGKDIMIKGQKSSKQNWQERDSDTKTNRHNSNKYLFHSLGTCRYCQMGKDNSMLHSQHIRICLICRYFHCAAL